MPRALDDELVMGLVELALQQPQATREAWLRTASGGDPELFDQAWDYVQWNHRMENFLLEPMYSGQQERHFSPGDFLAGRFLIVREVASGGMGIVYEARDQRLGRRIALKCARSGFNRRLPPEVRHASEISHPNVCRIFEIHTASTPDGEIDFFTMEFLEGDTLRARLKSGPLPAPDALTIGRQICAGVAEAHRNHVVHGDLKSNNVILSPGVRRKFSRCHHRFRPRPRPPCRHGRNRLDLRGGQPGRRNARTIWRPNSGKGEKPSLASDGLYALGVTLYELVANRLPYPRELPWQERMKQPPSLR